MCALTEGLVTGQETQMCALTEGLVTEMRKVLRILPDENMG